MKRLGRVSHYAKQGFLILRSSWVPSLNSHVYDKNLKLVGIVKDVFGPLRAPYVAIKPSIKKPQSYVGEILYVSSDEKRKRKTKRRRSHPRRKR